MKASQYLTKGKRYLTRKAAWLIGVDWPELWIGWQSYRKFRNLSVPERNVLMVEPNAFHAEILPGFVEYFDQIGFKTVLLCRKVNAESGAFCRVPESRQPMILPMNPATMKRCLRSKCMSRFEVLFLTSTYMSVRHGFFGLFFDYLGFTSKLKRPALQVEHHFPILEKQIDSGRFSPNHIFLLNHLKDQQRGVRMLNPHFFGQTKSAPLNPNRIVFVTVGSVTKRNRSFDDLIQAVQFLENLGHVNFVVKVIGRGADTELFKNASRHIEPMGFLDYPRMYSEVESAHFFLPLLNPELEGHRRYLDGETTGSRQLILGFSKVPVIHEQFADVYGFNGENALLHDSSGLAEGMLQAMKMVPENYQDKIAALTQLQKRVFAESLDNLKQAMFDING